MRTTLAFMLATIPSIVSAQTTETGFLDRRVTLDGSDYAYQVYVPAAYDPAAAWPVILFLHGMGERGSDGLFQTEVGLGRAVRRHPDRYPAIIVFPQTPTTATWQEVPGVPGPPVGPRLALAALDRTLGEFHTDSTRVYLTGLSMGGNGSWYLAYHHPERFAALVVVCGYVSGRWGDLFPPIAPAASPDPFVAVAQRVSRIPVWIFHGEEDPVVPVSESRGMAAALQTLGTDVRYTELPGIGHEAWDPAYDGAAFATWLFTQRRP
ncbi:MAG: alpha/beta hydrolase-fold protein [Gemmatimonadota bacterium]|nr:alpha/beta hydrolase-fold protein [Gemmatimonadota bacterium]